MPPANQPQINLRSCPAMEDTSFTYSQQMVTRAHRRKNRKGNARHGSPLLVDLVDRAKADIGSNGWITTCLGLMQDALRKTNISCPDVLCLGLGSPSTSREARAQLAFLISSCAILEIGLTNVSIYDPVFTDADKELFQSFGMQCLPDTDAKYALERPTILYMPHCDMKLYENIISANWSEECLTRMVFVANRFSDYTDNIPRSKLEIESPYLMRLVPHLECYPLPTLESFSSAFNNISIQHVRLPVPPSLVPSSRCPQEGV
ncbi:SRR1-domain-containing protein [Suillus ampliporus]|nr:SRR1-domain-containing protein [Suillus ampliporus]